MASPAHSPQHEPSSQSCHGDVQAPDTSLSGLVGFFVAARRALTATSHVYRANAIVAEARMLFEELVTLRARDQFLRSRVTNKIQNLRIIQRGLHRVSDDHSTDYKSLLRRLDDADARVKNIIQDLRHTAVESSFCPSNPSSKTLHDFVDEQGVDELRAFFRSCIDDVTAVQGAFVDSNEHLADEIHTLEKTLTSAARIASTNINEAVHDPVSLYHSLEAHATEMAQLIQSLIRHYDLCLTALKHTEGGGEAVQQHGGDICIDVPARQDGEQGKGLTPSPIGDEEREELLAVLIQDATEVEDVVGEIRERAAEMEDQVNLLEGQRNAVRGEHELALTMTKRLDVLGHDVFMYIKAGNTLMHQWRRTKQAIETRLEELEGLHDFFEGFLHAYYGLLVEVHRRQTVRRKMEKIAQDANVRIQSLYEEEMRARNMFREEHGDFLPSDIWSGLTAQPAHFELRMAVTPDIPEVSPEALQRALKGNSELI